LLSILATAERNSVEQVEAECQGLRYGDLKVRVGESVVEMLRPFQSEYSRLINEKDYLLECAKDGAQKAAEIAEKTLNKFKGAIGFVPRQG
ncbi:MAG: tryptophan--tRNA ligase, partial [Clostridia bacterium]|nr:tryptophan--tRNA ligase [Clostridia bacterium]